MIQVMGINVHTMIRKQHSERRNNMTKVQKWDNMEYVFKNSKMFHYRTKTGKQ